MKLKGVLGASLLLATVLASACDREDSAPQSEPTPAVVRTTRQEAKSDYNKVLILGSSVNGGANSPEAQVVRAYRPSAQITVVTDAQWTAMTANEFSQYHLIIIGDPGCVTGTAPFQAAVTNSNVWGPVVDSEVVIVGASTNAGGSQPLMQAGIHQALENGVQFFTSMYVSLGCAYRNAPANTEVPLLAPFGTFKVQGLATCADTGHRFWTYPDQFSNEVFDESLTGANGCSTRTVFTQYPVQNLTAAAIATDSTGTNPIPGRQIYEDFYDGLNFDGTPYVFIRNASAVGAGCGGDSNNIPSGEECDLGDGFNGQRGEICSFSCRMHWCGDGVKDAGEECDDGINNQRTDTGGIVNGRCSAFCKVVNVPNPNPPPVAVCRNVSVTVTNQCGMNADINNGSYDPGEEPVTCTQSPAGPYNIGNTTVTLTCSDPAHQEASCTGVVTVVDGVKPVVTVLGLNPQPLECNRSANYATGGFEPNPSATANDMCSGAVPVTKSGTVTMSAPGTYSRIYTATDAAGNAGTATRTVIVSDTVKPVITTAGTVSPLECKVSTYNDVPPTATDQCVGTVAVTTSGSVNVNAVGSYVLTYTARDPSGNNADPRTRTVAVRDTLAPTVTLQGSLTPPPVECGSAYADPGATASDVCAGALTAVPEPAVNPGQPNTYTVKYRATDPSGNTTLSTSARTVTVQDTLPPSLTLNGPATLGLECKAPYTEQGATANDQCTGTRQVTIAGTVNNVLLNTPQTVTYTANDGNGHSATATRTVTVSDTQAPAITIQGSLTPPPVECGGGYTDPGATANDACAGVVAATPVPPANPNVPGTYNVFYRATDPSGNVATSTSSRTVTVQDTLPPTVALNGAAAQGLECASAYTELGATASDQCAGNNLPVTIAGSVNNRQLGAQTLTYSATDGIRTGSKTRTVTVSDSLAPAITLNGPLAQQVECGDPAYADPGATASDLCAGPVPAVPVSPANPNQPNTYTVRYRATDPSGNSALSADSRTVTVQDTLLPTLNLAGANPQAVECGTAWADPGASASDQCAGALTPTRSGGVDHLTPADYSVTYTVNDGQPGHAVTRTRAVNVRDTLPPSITVNGPTNDTYACGGTYTDPGATATDACDAHVEIITTQTGSSAPGSSFTISYTARDDAGHEVTAPVSRTVTVTDDAPPTLVLQGSTSQVLECPTPFAEPGYTANDACYGDVTNRVQVTGSVTAGTPGNYTLTYNVTDPAGQSAPALTRSVRVQDTQRPQVTVNGQLDITLECGAGSYTDQGASASDACAGPLTAVPSTTANPGAPGNYLITYTATDPSGNVGTSATGRTVHVVDSLAPQIALTGGNMTLECASPFNDPGATASDQCAGNIAVTVSGTVNNRQLGPQNLVYTANDGTNQATTMRVVTVNDTLAPAISVNGPLNDTFACGSAYVDPGATANDACAGSVPVTATQSGNANQPGSFSITYTARDPSGNQVTSPVSRTVTVNDDAPPTLVLLGSTSPSLECGTAFTEPGFTANDACFGDVTNRVQVSGSVNSGSPGSYPLTYTVTDPAGQSAPPATRTVAVSDTLAPSLTVLGSLNQQLQCDHAPYADPGATATDACAGNLTGAIQRVGSVNTGAAGSYNLSYRVTDPSGNTTTSGDVRTVTVIDNLPPTITLQGGTPATHECGSPFADPGATANDACAGDLTANINRTGAVNSGSIGQYTLGYSVTDPSGLTANTQRVVNVNDTLAPQLTLVGSASQVVECGPGYQDPGATATDACAGNLDGQIQVAGAANGRAVGNYTVSYTVADAAGNTAGPLNRAVQVRDTQAPVITVNGPLDQQFACGSTYVDPGATANDVCAGSVPVTATQSGNSNRPGTFTISYTATDPSNNQATSPVTRTVHVNDDLPPTLALVGPAVQRLECGSSFADQGATANDACFGDLTSAITVSGTVNAGSPRDYTLLYNVTDGAGNSAPSVSRTVEVRDTLAPTITVTGPTNTTYECGTTYADPGATATDACAGNLTSAIVATQTPDPNAPANFTVTYRVTDPSGNTTVSPVTRTVTVNDNTAPSIALNGPAVQNLECAPTAYNDLGATAIDSCSVNPQVTVVGTVDMTRNGTYTLTYTARDLAGNTSPSVSRTVNISDTTPPAITLNGANALTLECKVDTYTELGATGTDICSGPATISVSGTVDTQNTGFYLVRYTATDASGNTNQTVRNVNVEDNLPPTLALNGPNPLIMECATPYSDPGATASDVCQGNVSDTVFVEFNGVNNMVTNYGNNPGTTDPYKVRYQANDHRGHTVTLERDVRVRDTTGPVLSVTGAPVAEIECGDQPDLGVVATDACYGSVPVTASPAQLPRAPGEYDVTYSAVDPAGNTTVSGASRHFTVVDTTEPVLTVNGPELMYYECTGHAIGNVWNNPGASATDTCEGELQVHQYNTGDDDGDGIPGMYDPDDFGPGPTTEVEGLYYVQYLAWDESYNIQGRILSVYVQDTLKPVLILNGEETVQTQCFFPTDDPTDADEVVDVDPNPYVDAGATGDDQCYGDVTPLVQSFSTVDKQSPGTYIVEYQVRDGAFNWADPITRTVQVVDNQSPKLKLNAPIKVFPANNEMRRVDLSECGITWDRCDGYMDIMDAHNVNVVSNEPVVDGDAGDIQFDPDSGTFYVRSKRNTNNTARVYTATWRNYDAAGNFVNGTCKVYVPVNANDPAPSALQSGTDITARR